MADLTLASPIPEAMKTEGGVAVGYCWVVDGAEFIAHADDAALIAGLETEPDADPGAVVGSIAKIEIVDGLTAPILWGPSDLFALQRTDLVAAGLLA